MFIFGAAVFLPARPLKKFVAQAGCAPRKFRAEKFGTQSFDRPDYRAESALKGNMATSRGSAFSLNPGETAWNFPL